MDCDEAVSSGDKRRSEDGSEPVSSDIERFDEGIVPPPPDMTDDEEHDTSDDEEHDEEQLRAMPASANSNAPSASATPGAPPGGPESPGVQMLCGFFMTCMTSLMRNLIGPVYPRYGTSEYGLLFDSTILAQYL